MARSIFLIAESGNLTELREEAYDSEDILQRLLASYPSVLTGDSRSEGTPARWLLVKREASVPDAADGAGRWSIDHVFLDQDGVPTIVEVKRSSDTRIRREVVGQMLDYAANAVAYWPVDHLRSAFEARCLGEARDPEVMLADTFADVVDADAFWRQVKTNIQAGRIRLVFVADEIPAELRRVVEFLNEQMDPAEVLAIEVRQYVANGLRTLVPTVVGRTAEAQQRKGTTARQWDEHSLLSELQRLRGPEVVNVAKEILTWANERTTKVWWGKGQQSGSFVPVYTQGGVGHPLFALYSSGVLEIYFQWLIKRPAFSDEAPRQELRRRLNAIPGVSIPENALRKLCTNSAFLRSQGNIGAAERDPFCAVWSDA